MTEAQMAQRIKTLVELVPQLERALRSFHESGSQFRLLRSIWPSSITPVEPRRPASSDESPRTLFILDSSFNPPSIAHRSLAQSVLQREYADQYPGPYRLLLLFSTMNADKAPSAASFHQRLAMMTIFAQDIMDDLLYDSKASHRAVPIDIGVTTAPYYTDKSQAIEAQGLEWYPDKPNHVHLVGFDTLTRFFGAKYYSRFNPPFSALSPYFDEGGHRLRVTLRPDDSYGTVEEQHEFVNGLRDGKMEKDGAKREWAEQVELVPPQAQAGVSSTKIRRAAGQGSWSEVDQLCTRGVATWLREQQLYDGDDRGVKLA